MKTKTIPFDLETAKKIQAGEIEGQIKTRDGDKARILCADLRNSKYPIAAAVFQFEIDYESIFQYCLNGSYMSNSIEHHCDLVLEVPDNEPQRESKQNFETVAESDAYAEGYENGFRAGRCIAFDDKGMALKTNEQQFKPFDRVLVRNDDEEIWQPRLYEMYSGGTEKHYCQDGQGYLQCIPYEGNEHLVDTTNNSKS